MKKIILKFDSEVKQEKFNELFQAALNYGIYDIYVDDLYNERIMDIDRVQTYSKTLKHKPDNLILGDPSEEELVKHLS